MKSAEIRESFLKFFEGHGHTRVKSSSTIPAADPTLLFTNAGMNQFKDCFLGLNDPGYRRATTAQKCVRAGGKHNDLENVGYTPRHHTFFEMLGNFSFGDYFKKDAIAFAWDLVTNKWGIPKDRLRVTVFRDDDEAFDLWKAQGLNPDWIERLGEKDNFWAMGDTGPCGPCSEIYFDFEPGKATGTPGTDDKRFLEIWNLVFMQFNRDSSGKMEKLPKPSVDTGAGLERVAAVLQGKFSNYDSDVFAPLIADIAKKVGKSYSGDDATSMRVIADHMRACSFLIADGAIPGNEGRGYVLRRILRRAIRHGKKLGQEKPFLFDLVGSVANGLGSVYPELVQQKKHVEELMREEEQKFHETLHRGMGLLDDTMERLRKDQKTILPGDVAFKLYDTFGFPYDLIEVITREHNLGVDQKGFDERMAKQRSLSVFNKGERKEAIEKLTRAVQDNKWITTFTGYEGTVKEQSTLLGLFDENGAPLKAVTADKPAYLIFEETPFYAESGGQVGDNGNAEASSGDAEIVDTFKIGKAFVHEALVRKGTVTLGAQCRLVVDAGARKRTAINHTATHLLHAALRKTLGDRVKQAGSLVDGERLRFDFTFPRGVTPEERQQIEAQINDQVRQAATVSVEEMSYDDAIKSGALAFFDEKYGDRVRVVRVGGKEDPMSVELCGGTHLSNITDIAFFKILSESSVASGVRRIEAVTADGAIGYLLEREGYLRTIERALNTTAEIAPSKIEALLKDAVTLKKENEDLRLKVAQGATKGDGGKALHDQTEDVGGLKVVAVEVPSANPKILRTLVDQVRDKLKQQSVVALACTAEGKVSLCVGLTKDLVGRFDAGKLIQPMAKALGGTGGGRGDFAQGGGPNVQEIPSAMAILKETLRG